MCASTKSYKLKFVLTEYTALFCVKNVAVFSFGKKDVSNIAGSSSLNDRSGGCGYLVSRELTFLV